jgi:hypothetical protein
MVGVARLRDPLERLEEALPLDVDLEGGMLSSKTPRRSYTRTVDTSTTEPDALTTTNATKSLDTPN